MDPRRNPYTPNAGARPPALVGRDGELGDFEVLLARLSNGATEQSMIVTGLRGVGKTVLLGAFREVAERNDWITAEAEVTKGSPFATTMSSLGRRALLSIAPRARWTERARRAASVLKSFTLTVSPDGTVAAGLDVDATEGMADSGNLSDDLTDVLVVLGQAAEEHGTGVVFLFDEIQFLDQIELEALIAALHRTVQRSLPITFVGAGLPQIPRLVGEAKSYAERLFTFPTIGRLRAEQATEALVAPATRLGVSYTDQAIAEVLAFTEGYPYFLQEYGKVLWNQSDGATITVHDVATVMPLVEAKLDESFFRVRADRTTDLELRYLRAMASLGSDPQKAGDVAKVLGRTAEQLGPVRARLIDKGLLYTSGYGLAAFTVPQFDRYLIRNYELIVPPLRRRAK